MSRVPNVDRERPAARAPESVADTRRALALAFARAGLDTPQLDARILVGHALGLDHAALVAASSCAVGAEDLARIDRLARRRLRREPVARITGEKEFWGLSLRVTADTLIPRPETETVVEEALAAVDAAGKRAAPLRLADLGIGTGAILLALLSELPNAFGVGVDCSAAAIAVAGENARRHALHERAAFAVGDFAAPLAGGFDLIVSNPPYVESGEIAGLSPEVRDHEPRLALDGGVDGLDAYRRLANQAPCALAPDGLLVVEIGRGQERAVSGIFIQAGLAARPAIADLAGVPRALILSER